MAAMATSRRAKSMHRMQRRQSRSRPPPSCRPTTPKELLKPQQLLQIGSLIKNRWRVEAQLNKGAFGEVYIVYDTLHHRTAAAKVESLNSRLPLLSMEANVMRKMQTASTFVPRFFGCGHNDAVNYVVMQLLGRSLAELKKSTPEDRFSLGTALRVAEMMCQACRDLHHAGFLHRDIKPANFTIGLPGCGAKKCCVYMIDFGLCRPFIDQKTGKPIPARARVGFRGTARYASISSLSERDVGRCDDLWSVVYVFIEMALGQLPWRRVLERSEILARKLNTPVQQLLPKEVRPELWAAVEHLQTLQFESEPDYCLLLRLLRKCMVRLNVNESGPLDWESQMERPRRQMHQPTVVNRASVIEMSQPAGSKLHDLEQ